MPFNKAKALAEAERSVSQKKYAQAIKQYLEIVEKDPKDFALLNTTGDLCVREGNIRDALRLFHRLGEAYVAEGFRVKAIAIYKKISKLDPQAVDPLIKLGELYAGQKLMREAREQYAQAFEMCAGKNKAQALEVIRRLVALDPENTDQLNRLAQVYEAAGRRAEAAEVYAQVADLALRRGDTQVAEPAARKAGELGAGRLELQLMRARLAFESGRPEEAEQILTASPELASNPAIQELRMNFCLESGDLGAARELALEMFRTRPDDFSPLASFCTACRQAGELDSAFETLAGVADEILEAKEPPGPTEPLLETLRSLWSARPLHIPTLELILRIGRETSDETVLPEVLEALGHACVQAGRLEEAETAYRELAELEPESEANQALLRQVLQKAGKAPVDESAEAPSEPEATAEPTSLVEEALESSDLYSRYGLVDRAVAELEKVLDVYPDRVELHKRILDLCQKKNPARAARAAEELCGIYTQQNSPSHARGYAEMARRLAGTAEGSPTGSDAASSVVEPLAISGGDSEAVDAPEPQAVDSASRPSPVSVEAGVPGDEWDLSTELERGAGLEMPPEAVQPAAPPAPPPPFDVEDQRSALHFYLEYGFLDEARDALLALEQKFPRDPHVAALRQMVEEWAPEALASPSPTASAITTPEAGSPNPWPEPVEPREEAIEFFGETSRESGSHTPQATPAPAAPGPGVTSAVAFSEEIAAESIATARDEVAPQPLAAYSGEVLPAPGLFPAMETGQPAHGIVENGLPPAGSVPALSERNLADDEVVSAPERAAFDAEVPVVREAAPALDVQSEPLASSPFSPGPAVPLAGEHDLSAPPPATPVTASRESIPGISSGHSIESSLRSLLADLGPAEERVRRDDADTHYHLGVAFREMELYDEAISEFQKVMKGARKDRLPPRFLQTCSQLAHCFMEKRLPAVAVKWYLRALEAPDLDEEARLALKYELGLAYEQAGSCQPALENYLEVYSQNIEYRDVADRIRILQQKPT